MTRYLRPTGLPFEVYDYPASHAYHIEEGVLCDPRSEIKPTDRLSQHAQEVAKDWRGPELRTRGADCPPDNVDTTVRVRFTQPRRNA